MTTAHDWADADQLIALPPTAWIDDAITSARFGTVAHLVTNRFDRYARVLHPAERTVHTVPVKYIRWADVARATGAIAHARMQWDAIADTDDESPLAFWNEGPSSTNLIPNHVVAEIAAQLGDDECYFAVWDGNSSLHGVNRDLPKATIDQHRFHIMAGTAADATRTFHGLRPNLWWANDRSWIVASNIDLVSTYVGGTADAIDRLLHSPVIEAWQVSANDDVTITSDTVNWPDGPPQHC
ncbi:hypothetical protein L5I01_28720 [Gordonia sp. HY442]|uniref:hypothetical protein n=1 Tax=Gordonia zhenghanii TaxID=2911516 RepID=UPI001F17C935|nr:hypothetical protein [Gordonia zhenghanii]MCF8607348.1 hypothetical protein [Gordonia zhenghanii]